MPTDVPIVVRPTAAADAPALRTLRLEALAAHPVAFTADLAETAARPADRWDVLAGRGTTTAAPGVVIVADAGGTLVGMAGVYTPGEPKLAHAGTVWGVYVRAAARGRGTGAALVRACAGWAAGQGLAVLRLSAVGGADGEGGDGAARRCYERSGFVAYGVEPLAVRWDGRFYDETLMALRLPRPGG